jgi:hypothetical protein
MPALPSRSNTIELSDSLSYSALSDPVGKAIIAILSSPDESEEGRDGSLF